MERAYASTNPARPYSKARSDYLKYAPTLATEGTVTATRSAVLYGLHLSGSKPHIHEKIRAFLEMLGDEGQQWSLYRYRAMTWLSIHNLHENGDLHFKMMLEPV